MPVNHDQLNEKEVIGRRSLRAEKQTKKTFSGNIGGHEQHNHNIEDIRRHQQEIEDEDEGHKDDKEGSQEENENEVEEEDEELSEQDYKDGRTMLHIASGLGDIETVKKILNVVVIDGGSALDALNSSSSSSSDIIHSRDINGWQAIHEAARGGHLDILEYLVNRGADLSAKTKQGETPLWWAREAFPEGHLVIAYLEGVRAPSSPSESGNMNSHTTITAIPRLRKESKK